MEALDNMEESLRMTVFLMYGHAISYRMDVNYNIFATTILEMVTWFMIQRQLVVLRIVYHADLFMIKNSSNTP